MLDQLRLTPCPLRFSLARGPRAEGCAFFIRTQSRVGWEKARACKRLPHSLAPCLALQAGMLYLIIYA